MNDQPALRVGGYALLIGGVGAIVVNVLHPRPPEPTEELLTLVASVPHWRMLHYLAALATVLIVSGFALLVRTLHDPTARALGEAGKYVTMLGAAAFIVAIVVDGHGYPLFAARWLAAAGGDRAAVLLAASAVQAVDVALFPVWSAVFLGLGPLLLAAALLRSAEQPRLLTVFGIAGAAMCLVYGLGAAAGVRVPLPLWPLGPAVVTLWITALGARLLRRGPVTARR